MLGLYICGSEQCSSNFHVHQAPGGLAVTVIQSLSGEAQESALPVRSQETLLLLTAGLETVL